MSRWHISFRLDLRRALLAIGGVFGILSATYYFATREPAEKIVLRGFGHETRVGSILLMPLEGDTCRQFAFNNDNGTILEGELVSCMDALVRWEKSPRK